MRQTTSILLIMMIFLAGCGGNITPPAKEKQVVKIGASLALSGDLAFFGETVKNSMELAVKDLKDSKYDYQLVFEDDKLDPKTASTAATKLIQVDNVDAIISWSSGTGNAVAPIAQENKVIHFNPVASDANVAKGFYNFIHWTQPNQEAMAWADEASKRDIKRIAIIVMQHQGLQAISDAVKNFSESEGMTVVNTETFAPGEKDFRSSIMKIKASNPDIIFIGALDPELPLIYTQMKELGVKTPVSCAESFELTKDPSLFNGQWYASASDPTVGFTAKYKAAYGKDPQISAPNAYDVVNLIVAGYEKAGKDSAVKPTHEEVANEILKIKDFDGAVGRIDVGEEGIVRSKASIKMIIDGKPVTQTYKASPGPTFGVTKPIIIGASLPLTGEAASFGIGAKAGIEVALKEINDAGGINGRLLKIIYEDDKCSKDGVNVMTKFTTMDNVDAIIGPVCSAAAGPGLPIVQQAGVPAIIIASAPPLTKIGDHIFRIYPSDSFAGRFSAKYITENLKAKKVALVYVQNDYGQGLADEFRNTLKTLGVDLVVDEGLSMDTTDTKTVVSKIQAVKPDAIYIPLYPQVALVFLKQLRELGVDAQVIGPDVLETNEMMSADVAQGTIEIIGKVDNPQSLKDKVAQVTGENYTNAITSLGYDAVNIYADVMGRVGTDKTAVRDALASGSFKAVSTPSIEFDENRDLKTVIYDIKRITNKTSVVIGGSQ